MKSVLKRGMALLLVLCLPLGAALAEAQDINLYPLIDFSDADARRIQSAGGVGDSMYLLMCNVNGGSGLKAVLERWKPGMQQPETLLEGLTVYRSDDGAEPEGPIINRLFSDGKALYGYDQRSRQVTRLVDENGQTAVAELCVLEQPQDEQSRDEADYYDFAIRGMFAMDGALVMQIEEYGMDAVNNSIARYDLTTGKLLDSRKTERISAFCPYRDGLLLAVLQPEAELDAQEMPIGQIVRYDPATGETQTLATLNTSYPGGLAYSAANDTAYYTDGATVYALPGLAGEPHVSAYLPVTTYQGADQSFFLLDGGMIVYAGYEGAYVRRLDAPGVENGALTIYGEGGSDRHMAVVAEHPEISITQSDDYFSDMEQLTAAMVSGENTVDVLRLSMANAPLSRLIDKGYAADLSGYPELMALAQRMDPRFIQPLMRDGRLYALPVAVSAYTLGVNQQAMEMLGLTEDDLPDTWPAFLDFAANFYYDYGEENPEVTLLMNPMMKKNLFNTIMEQYVAAQLRDGGVISFDTPQLRALLQALEAIDFTELDPYELLGDAMWEGDADEINEFYQKKGLFTIGASAGPQNLRVSEYSYTPLALALDERTQPVIPAQMGVMLVNPRSAHMDQAAAYLTAYTAQYREEAENIMFFPDQNDPVPNRYYETEKRNYEEAIRDLDARIEKADESEKAALEAERTWMQKYLDELEQNRMSVTAEMIEQYRSDYAPYLYPMPQTPFTTWDSNGGNELQTLISQYMDEAIDLDTFIREVDKRVRMMMLEDM